MKNVSFQFQYAKGQFCKVVTLWATLNGSSSPVQISTWTYQPTNWSAVAALAVSPPYFTAYSTQNGIGTVALACGASAVISSGSCADVALVSNPVFDLTNFNSPCLTM